MSRSSKFYYQRVNMLLVAAHFIIACVLGGLFSGKDVNPFDSSDDWLATGDSVKDILVALIYAICAILFGVVCLFGCFAVCFRICPCLFVLVPITAFSSFILIVIGTLADHIDDLVIDVCGEKPSAAYYDDIYASFDSMADQFSSYDYTDFDIPDDVDTSVDTSGEDAIDAVDLSTSDDVDESMPSGLSESYDYEDIDAAFEEAFGDMSDEEIDALYADFDFEDFDYDYDYEDADFADFEMSAEDLDAYLADFDFTDLGLPDDILAEIEAGLDEL